MPRYLLHPLYCFYVILVVAFGVRANPLPFSTQPMFASVDQAFSFDFDQQQNKLMLNWQILPGYYLYQHKISVTPHQAVLEKLVLPPGKTHQDEFFGKVIIYSEALALEMPILSAEQNSYLTITYQGCAEAGYCYPPETKTVPLTAVVASDLSDAALTLFPSAEEALVSTVNTLPFSPLWAVIFGLLIAFTPCVLPIYPLILPLVLGEKRNLSTRRVLLLSFCYIQGMALTYTLLGVVIAALGLQFQAALQHPYVLITLAAVFVLLAFSMFGFYSLQLPSSWQTRLILLSNHQRGGSAWGVFIMGGVAGLICSPCTTAPLSAILLYIAQSGSLLLGGITLYLYALGMGLPLIALALFGHRLLPRSGPWMQYIKEGFGFVILALPVFLLERVLGDLWGSRMWALLAALFFGWAFILSLRSSKAIIRIFQLLLLITLLVVVRPLQDWVFGSAVRQQMQELVFERIASVDELEQALTRHQGRKIMLDLYADWCVACKEYEKYTFSDPAVQHHLMGMVLLKADVTANNEQDLSLYRRLQVTGLPTLIFFNEQGQEIRDHRINGFLNAENFLQQLKKMDTEYPNRH